MSDLHKAAQALVDRWDTPLWKDAPHTGVFIDALRAALAQPEQEPVAHRIFDGEGGYVFVDGDPSEFDVEWSARYRRKYEPLYTAPPQRNTLPLSDDEIKCIKPICADFVSFRAGVRHAEREHGIGGEHD